MTLQAKSINAPREVVEGTCPGCGEESLQRYQVVSEGGWYTVLKCQHCLHTLERSPWSRLGYVNRDQAALFTSRARGHERGQ